MTGKVVFITSLPLRITEIYSRLGFRQNECWWRIIFQAYFLTKQVTRSFDVKECCLVYKFVFLI